MLKVADGGPGSYTVKKSKLPRCGCLRKQSRCRFSTQQASSPLGTQHALLHDPAGRLEYLLPRDPSANQVSCLRHRAYHNARRGRRLHRPCLHLPSFTVKTQRSEETEKAMCSADGDRSGQAALPRFVRRLGSLGSPGTEQTSVSQMSSSTTKAIRPLLMVG